MPAQNHGGMDRWRGRLSGPPAPAGSHVPQLACGCVLAAGIGALGSAACDGPGTLPPRLTNMQCNKPPWRKCRSSPFRGAKRGGAGGGSEHRGCAPPPS